MLASVGLFASGWPAVITNHAWVVWTTLAIGMLIVALGYLIPEKQAPTANPPTSSSASVHAPIHFAPVINVGNVGEALVSPQPSHAPEAAPKIGPEPPKEADSSAHLDLSFERMPLIYRLDQSAWGEATQFDNDSKDALIAWFTNPVPQKGMSGVDASGLSAHIKYFVEGHWSRQVSRGYWLHCSANEVRIGIADRAGLILGLADWSHWVSYANPYPRPADDEFLQPAMRRPGEKVEMPKAAMDIELSLLSHGTVTLDQRIIHLTFPGGKPYAVKRP
jgi:hypothetical protein